MKSLPSPLGMSRNEIVDLLLKEEYGYLPDTPVEVSAEEEIADYGYAVMSFCYEDITSDDNDFTNGLAGLVYPDGERGNSDCGKIGLWAWQL